MSRGRERTRTRSIQGPLPLTGSLQGRNVRAALRSVPGEGAAWPMVTAVDSYDLAQVYAPEDPVSAYALGQQLWREVEDWTDPSLYLWRGSQDVALADSVARRLDRLAVRQAALDSAQARMEDALCREYGYLLPELTGAQFHQRRVRRADIHLGARAHAESVAGQDLAAYRAWSGPRGLVVPAPGTQGYRLVDGYHRVLADTDAEMVVIVACDGQSPSPA